MAFKTLLFCAQALLIQSIASQCIGYKNMPYDAVAYGAPLAAPYPGPAPCNPYDDLLYAAFAPTNGGSFAVSSTSPMLPSGISVLSENVIEGPLSVGGILPFLGSVALEAVLPTAGAGTVAYNCGNGEVGITAEDYGYPAALAAPAACGPGYAGPGYPGYGPGYGYGPNGCGPMY